MIIKDFDIEQTLECGQCFNFEKLDDHDYIVIAHGRALHISQSGEDTDFHGAPQDDIRNIWFPYFDLDKDYSVIKSKIIKEEPRLSEVINKYSGLRLMNQEFTETLISFIISQNKNIPQIKKIVRSICDGFGKEVFLPESHDDLSKETEGIKNKNIGNEKISGHREACLKRKWYAFPDDESLGKMTEEDFRDLKTGFRAPYIMNAINSSLNEDVLRKETFEEAKQSLMKIKGVGDKVANCVLLFSLGFKSAFPVDVWIKRIMEEMYFEGKDTSKKEIERFAADKFGKWGGYAQQYLFMYVRNR